MTAARKSKASRKEDVAVAAILTAPTIAHAAESIGVSEQTLWRWMQDSEFQRKLAHAKRQAVNHAITRLQQACATAVETLEGIMKDKKAPAHSRVTAARSVLEFSMRGVELEDLAVRVDELEQIAQTQGGL